MTFATRLSSVAFFVVGVLLVALPARAQTDRVRDLEEYAMAACLVAQDYDAYLKDQGHRWARIAVDRRALPLEILEKINVAVRDRLSSGDMIIIRDETSPTGDSALPLAFCIEIVDAPEVRAAISEARDALEHEKAQ